MGLRSTFRPTLGPLQVSTDRDMTPNSVTIKVGPFRYRLWSKRSQRGLSSIDLPGPISYRPTETPRPRDNAPAAAAPFTVQKRK